MPPPLTASAWLRFDAIRRAFGLVHPRSVLEIGAGQGALATWLAPRYEYVGAELDDQSRAVATARLATVGAGRIVKHLSEVGDRRFDAVCAFEVLEHIEDDRGALSDWRRYLEPGGAIVLSVPAHSSRFGPIDELAGHFRRYDAPVLTSVLEDAGFRVVSLECWGAFLGHGIDRIQNAIAERKGGPSDKSSATAASGRYGQPSGPAPALVRAAVAAPFRVAQIPFRDSEVGIGWVALARLAP